ncbi:SnoaL-like domain-containing protein [Rhodococcus sp. 14C212]|uniref:ester cyclase n=1 Tax=Rhodococcus sp. 14C212 TaxID=2711209 RepID=UPI0013ED0EF0|nr:ester cyclase [Rhodococcus sp. 14C212]NGP05154.1 SnoaL-like domain-containing protein [Rhodococcus sp. 14C212]
MDTAFFDRYRDAWNSHDVDAVVEFFTDDGVYEDATLGRRNRGTAEIRAFVEETFAAFPDFRVEDAGPATIDPSGRFANEWTMSGTHEADTAIPATHRSFSLRGASVGEFEGDKITRNSDYWNMAEFLVQVGMLPSPPAV